MSDFEPMFMPQPPYGARERVVPHSLAVTDAALDVFLSTEARDIGHKWKRITLGSTVHLLTTDRPRYTAELRLRAVSEQQTQIVMAEQPGSHPQWTIYLAWLLKRFIQWMNEERERLRGQADQEPDLAQAEVDTAPPALPTAPKRRGGAPTKEANDWARAQIVAGEPRNKVFFEWLRKRGLDATDPDIQQQWRDAFRKAITRKGRTDET